ARSASERRAATMAWSMGGLYSIRRISQTGRRPMKNDGFDRRSFLKGSVAGGVAAALSPAAQAQAPKQPATAPDAPAAQPAGYAFLNPDEALFVEALVDHMVPADEHSPKGTDIGINVFIDRALAGGWGKGDR